MAANNRSSSCHGAVPQPHDRLEVELELAVVDRQADRLEDGPIFVDLKVEPGEAYPEDFRRLYSIEYRDKFREALKKS